MTFLPRSFFFRSTGHARLELAVRRSGTHRSQADIRSSTESSLSSSCWLPVRPTSLASPLPATSGELSRCRALTRVSSAEAKARARCPLPSASAAASLRLPPCPIHAKCHRAIERRLAELSAVPLLEAAPSLRRRSSGAHGRGTSDTIKFRPAPAQSGAPSLVAIIEAQCHRTVFTLDELGRRHYRPVLERHSPPFPSSSHPPAVYPTVATTRGGRRAEHRRLLARAVLAQAGAPP
jgi:hypothetical protein